LLEAASLGGGTSGACAGRAQVSESQRGRHMDVVLAGLAGRTIAQLVVDGRTDLDLTPFSPGR
jgi:hypothetical protein